jgi:hypothetical protein
MKVELERSEKKALLKECLWMGESEGNPEGGQDEASQQPIPSNKRCSTEENRAMSPSDQFIVSFF